MLGKRKSRVSVPEAKCHATLARYPLRRIRVPSAAGVLDLVVPDARAWRNAGKWVERVQRGAEPPYWTRIWPSSIATARFLQRLSILGGSRVLDLGCGLGLAGVAAVLMGARVLFVDREPDALAFARWNAERSTEVHPDVETIVWNWGLAPLVGVHDVIVLSDVSYSRGSHEPLIRQVGESIDEHGLVIHADPVRDESTRFLECLRVEFETWEIVRAVTHDGVQSTIRLCFAIRRLATDNRWRAPVAAFVREERLS
jgi:predicted nicotinamide N-methyase